MAKKNILVVNAIGGLGNRIRTIAASNGLAALTNRRLQVIWRNNSDVAADFTDIFMPLPDEIELRQPGWIEYSLLWQIPSKKESLSFISCSTPRIQQDFFRQFRSWSIGFIRREALERSKELQRQYPDFIRMWS